MTCRTWQAEGAIEGVHTDYQLPNAWSTEFGYSRFSRATPPTPSGKLAKRTASTSEWDGKGWFGKKREL